MTDTSQPYIENIGSYKDYHTENHYTLINNAYLGTGGFFGNPLDISYIIPSRKESLWQERVRRAMYVNMVEPFATAQYKPVFTEQPPVTTVLDSNDKTIEVSNFGEWIEDVDGSGLTKNQFYENVCLASYLDGVAYVVEDKGVDMTQPVVYLQKASTVDRSMLVVDRYGRLKQIAFIVVDHYDSKDNVNILRRTTWTDTTVTVETAKEPRGGLVDGQEIKWTGLLAISC